MEFDSYNVSLIIILVVSTLFYFLLNKTAILNVGNSVAEYYALIFFIFSGIIIANSYTNLLMLFLGIEIMSIPQYILAGSDKKNLKSNEAALKYFLMGAFTTGILLLGIAFLYGATGTFNIKEIPLAVNEFSKPLFIAGVVLVLASFSFKVSAAPFHFWTPDVYDGTPTPFTSYMATVVKVGAFGAFIRLFASALGTAAISEYWVMLVAIIAAATLIIGNITAVFQQSVKRMLAYSSISQAGFMLFAIIGLSSQAYMGLLVYAAAYCIASIGLFAILVHLKDYTYDGFNGLGKTDKTLAFVATICVLSLAGIPLTAGFFAKYFVLSGLINAHSFIWLAVIALLCAAVGLSYYFKIIQAMYFKNGEIQWHTKPTQFVRMVLVLMAILIIVLGIFPNLVLKGLINF
jgi:NADH-quinone oxidoreductase subunit N